METTGWTDAFLDCCYLHNTMLAQQQLRLGVCLSHAGIVSKHRDWSSRFLSRRLPATYPTLYYRDIWPAAKMRALPAGNLSQTVESESVTKAHWSSLRAVSIYWWGCVLTEINSRTAIGQQRSWQCSLSTSVYSTVCVEAARCVGLSVTANTCALFTPVLGTWLLICQV